MIEKIVHIRDTSAYDFADKLRREVAEMQNECKLDVEVQYQTAMAGADHSYIIIYSAVIIGRERR